MPAARPRITLITTGGTIAGAAASATDLRGYTAGQLDGADLLAAVPQLAGLATVSAEPLFALDSKDMTPAHWLALSRRVQALVDDPTVDGIVITHGTDTLEESAYFLTLTVARRKPVVLTAAMRPATALSADGPLNLYQAVQLAARPAAARAGVLAVLGDRILPAATLAKRHPSAVDAFTQPGALTVTASDTALQALAGPPAAPLRLPAGLTQLPPVEILTVAAGSTPALLGAAVRSLHRAPDSGEEKGAGGADAGAGTTRQRRGPSRPGGGLVLALPGNASLPAPWRAALEALPPTLPVVLASRCGGGTVARGHALPAHWLHAGPLDALKARVRLIAALAAGLHGARLQRWFERV
ncbi:asparaginase [Thauera aromatica]|uniref:L-asparaginase n=1 Tax=Thauera aromatica K172 TaxID=44139 RepID=A0A2R4BKD7_THAAR|nr:asparaginase [Thauera aromatica]AVR87732.1 L-asparaginase [Thauera aromatica K172]